METFLTRTSTSSEAPDKELLDVLALLVGFDEGVRQPGVQEIERARITFADRGAHPAVIVLDELGQKVLISASWGWYSRLS